VASEVKQLATETATSSERVNDVIEAVTGQTDAAAGFASTVTAVTHISEVQIASAAWVEEQAAVLAEVARQLCTASRAAHDVLTGLDQLVEHAVHRA
jgi:methyl-accepting chemotaxis protein